MLKLTPHPELHAVFETLGYLAGFTWYSRERRRLGDVIGTHERWNLIAAAMVGGLVGSRFFGLMDEFNGFHFGLWQLITPGGGKTIVGGLIGGWLAVEAVKKLNGTQTRTGDLFALPLCVGIAIGRIGCLLAGIGDDTYGKPTAMPWGVDFGDGVARHPTQAYEVVFLLLLAFVLSRIGRREHIAGVVFQWFMSAYLAWRVLIDFLKPRPVEYGMSLLQWVALGGLSLSLLHSLGQTRIQSPKNR